MLFNGFEKGKVHMIAERPGCGKSVLSLNLALNIASNPFVDKSVLYVSTELDMSEQVFSDLLTANFTHFLSMTLSQGINFQHRTVKLC